MAKLTAPPINFGGDPPNSESELILAADLMEGGPPAILSREVLVSPTFDQLVNDPGVGYPF